MPRSIRSIRAKLMLLTILSSGVGLLLVGTLLGLSGYRHDYESLGERAATQARITAANSAAAVAFGDATAARKTLEALSLDADVISARIQLEDGTALARIGFGRPRGRRPLSVSAPVLLGERIGAVELEVSSAAIDEKLRNDALILLAVLAGAMGVALLCAAGLHRIVSKPYVALAETKEQLEKALDEANAAASAKAQFLANMSHEIRTPMNGVIGMLDLVDVQKLDVESRSMIETARGAADSLLSIINDVLDFSKIEAGKLTLESIDVDIRGLVEEVATIFAAQAHAKGVELTCAIHADVPSRVRSDPTRLRQILVNLVGNAVKFTERGEVFVGFQAAARAPAPGTQQNYQLLVSDTGIGMSEAASGRLFQAFTQADGSTTRRYGGTGLGLAITKRLIEAFGGSLRLKSAPGAGTTFSVYIPMQPVADRSTSEHTDLRGRKVLIVDDNPTNRCVLEHYLSREGVSYHSVASAREGLEALRLAVRQNELFDVVLLDYQMPDVDGIGFLRELRADRSIDATRCILLSSLGDRTQESSTLGVAAWLTKPVRRTQLLVTLHSVLSGESGALVQRAAPAASTSTFAWARVLLVEDNEVNQKVAARMLNTWGLDPLVVSDGAQAVAAVRAHAFDLIFMDCQMPVMDGYAATRAIRKLSSVPIVAMTANALAGDRERCIQSGMNDFVAKPVKKAILRTVLERWLGGGHRADVMAELPSPPSSPVAVASSPILDSGVIEQLRQLMGHEFDGVVAAYLQDVPRQVAAIEEALARGDRKAIESFAQSVKASSRSIGALAVGGVAERLESHAKSQTPSDETHRLFAALTSAFHIVSSHLRDLPGEAGGRAESVPRFIKGAPNHPARRGT